MIDHMARVVDIVRRISCLRRWQVFPSWSWVRSIKEILQGILAKFKLVRVPQRLINHRNCVLVEGSRALINLSMEHFPQWTMGAWTGSGKNKTKGHFSLKCHMIFFSNICNTPEIVPSCWREPASSFMCHLWTVNIVWLQSWQARYAKSILFSLFGSCFMWLPVIICMAVTTLLW